MRAVAAGQHARGGARGGDDCDGDADDGAGDGAEGLEAVVDPVADDERRDDGEGGEGGLRDGGEAAAAGARGEEEGGGVCCGKARGETDGGGRAAAVPGPGHGALGRRDDLGRDSAGTNFKKRCLKSRAENCHRAGGGGGALRV